MYGLSKEIIETLKIIEKNNNIKIYIFGSRARGIIQQAYASKVIDNGEIWIQMMLDRNSLSYLYDEKKSRIIYNNIRNKYILELKKLKQFLEVKI